jgi:hypothetical protein
MGEKRKTHFDNVTMLPFGSTILLMSVWTRDKVRYANRAKKRIKLLILPTPIGLNCNNFAIEQSFNKFLELKKILGNFRFVAKQVNPGEFTIVINKTDIIFFRPKESMAGPHTSENTSSKGAEERLDETGKGNW